MNKNVVISGASQGIGKAIAMAFAEQGCNLFLAARGWEKLQELKTELTTRFPSIKVHPYSVDFAKPFEISSFVELIKNNCACPDVIVNNVGQYMVDTIDNSSIDNLKQQMAVNVYSAYHLTQPFLQDMKAKQSGHIFNILSVAAKKIMQDAVSYSISKHAFAALNKVWQEELRVNNVKVTGVFPGATITESWGEMDGSKFVQPKHIADTVINAFLTPANTLIEEIHITPTALL